MPTRIYLTSGQAVDVAEDPAEVYTVLSENHQRGREHGEPFYNPFSKFRLEDGNPVYVAPTAITHLEVGWVGP